MNRLNLESCWAKLIRAEAHREAIEALEPRGAGFDGPRVGRKFDPDTGDHVVYISHCPDYKSLFIRIGLIFSEAIHNLRSTLDYLVYSLADWHTQGAIASPDQTQFPICDKPSGKRGFKVKAQRYLSEVHPFHVALIEKCQTYNPADWIGGDGLRYHPLGLLRDLSDADKHRLPHVVVLPTNIILYEGTALPFNEVLEFKGGPLPKTAELGAEVQRLVLKNRLPDVEVYGYLAANIALAERPGEPLILTLMAIERSVRYIVERFYPLSQP